jgi:hypothetical protein
VIRVGNPIVSAAIPGNDETLIRLWLNARSEHTWRAYEADVGGTLATVGKPIASTTLADLQAGIEPFEGKAPASRARKIGAAKPLLSFAERTGLLAFNIGGARAKCRGAAKLQGGGRLTDGRFCPAPVSLFWLRAGFAARCAGRRNHRHCALSIGRWWDRQSRIGSLGRMNNALCTIRAIFVLVWKRVTAIVEPAACIGGGDAVEGGREGGFERLGGTRLGGPQGTLELGPAAFDGREIGRERGR